MSTPKQPLSRTFGLRTLAVHAGQAPDITTGATATPIVATSSFAYDDFDAGVRRFNGEQPGFLYSRFANPTVQTFEAKMAALEGAESAVAFSSGSAAVSSTLLGLVSAGDEVIYVGTVYGGTDGILRGLLPRLGIRTIPVPDLASVQAQLSPRTRLIYVETPANPVMGIIDLAEVARIAHEAGILSVADNTFSTPCLTQPLALGIDVVVHSATKYIGGHGDATGGVALGRADLMKTIRSIGMKELGGCMSPHEAFMFIRGLKTLPLRIEAACDNAQQIAAFLHSHPAVERVYYPGLPSHPGHEIARRQMRRFGGILSFEFRGGRAMARLFLDRLQLVTQAVSVGDVDSLACHPASTTHSAVAEAIRLKNGVTEGLVRFSAGIEDPEDLLADVEQALAHASKEV
ncbi:PLP-dependent aspartate aminotransferase family protein [Glaciimonas sp. PCH181]|uniref:trans-sulfuration enzyme family protein n=1 Tax=Glaciimonas sp. PCH181 TaxID=2133943 RepID=UPI000D374205|nr:PLP-dependent aspartate aminotransferase family protein [Glaciimonas sp. PCH181]PUA18677.1 methionine gamma-lyase [Glaciimonas sp. PCH181]